jgi:hypothetical protein
MRAAYRLPLRWSICSAAACKSGLAEGGHCSYRAVEHERHGCSHFPQKMR